jgi:hypothetical protein
VTLPGAIGANKPGTPASDSLGRFGRAVWASRGQIDPAGISKELNVSDSIGVVKGPLWDEENCSSTWQVVLEDFYTAPANSIVHPNSINHLLKGDVGRNEAEAIPAGFSLAA